MGNEQTAKMGKTERRKSKPSLSDVRAAAGRAGAIARWSGATREKTVQVRVYERDAAALKKRARTTAEAVRELLTVAGVE